MTPQQRRRVPVVPTVALGLLLCYLAVHVTAYALRVPVVAVIEAAMATAGFVLGCAAVLGLFYQVTRR